MQAPFSDFVIPSPLVLGALLAGTVAIGAMLYAVHPRVSQRTVLAMAPWVIVGASLHVFYQLGQRFAMEIYPGWAEPFFSAPAVYLTTFIGMGTVWLASNLVATTSAAESSRDIVARNLASIGAGIAVVLLALLGWQSLSPAIGPMRLIVPTLGLILSLVVAFVIYILVGAWRTYIVAEARLVGALVLFSHVFDGITTAIGVDIIGTTERSVLPARIMEFAADLPTAQYLGTGWLFVVVKMLLAVFVIVLFADYLSEEPTQGNLLFAAIAFVGLGPALNNFLLFFIGI